MPANGDLVAEALLRYFRDPVQYRAEMLRENEVTGNLDLVVRLALGRPVGLSSPGLLGASIAQELRRAAVFFVQQILFRDGASHYQVLGLTPDASPEAIRENHRLLIQVVHPDRHSTPLAWPESVAARVNRAYSVLRNADTRAAYDQQEAGARSKRKSGRRAASTFSTSAGGIVRTRRRVPVSALPEWLTYGVGGFFREHPVFTIFASLISLSVLVIGGIVWSDREVTLTRDVAKTATAPGPTSEAHVSAGRPKDGTSVSPVLLEAQEKSSAQKPVVGTTQSRTMPARRALDTPAVAE